MLSIDDLEHAIFHDLRPAIPPLDGERREGGQHIDARQTRRQLLIRPDMRKKRLADLLEELLFERDRFVLRTQRLAFEGLQLLRDVALGVLDRLLARPTRIRWNLLAIAIGDLDVVAEDFVEADLE